MVETVALRHEEEEKKKKKKPTQTVSPAKSPKRAEGKRRQDSKVSSEQL